MFFAPVVSRPDCVREPPVPAPIITASFPPVPVPVPVVKTRLPAHFPTQIPIAGVAYILPFSLPHVSRFTIQVPTAVHPHVLTSVTICFRQSIATQMKACVPPIT